MLQKLGKEIDWDSLEVDGVHEWDYPDYCDAYISAASYTDGTPLSDKDLDILTENFGHLAHEMAHGLHISRQADAIDAMRDRA